MSILTSLSLRQAITDQPYPEHIQGKILQPNVDSDIVNTSKRFNALLNQPEKEALISIIDAMEAQGQLTPEIITSTESTSKRLFTAISSKRKQQASFFEDWVAEYGLNNNEGLVLLKLTECFLRAHQSPLALTLVEDFIFQANWKNHYFHSKSTAVNLSTLFLDFGTKLLSSYESIANNHQLVHNTLEKVGAPLVIKIIKSLLVYLADTFVCGESIEEAVEKSQSMTHQQFAQSFDMLGEAALTLEEADIYYENYLKALKYLANQKTQAFVHTPALSIKLSALEPRYDPKHWSRAKKRLIPRLKTLFALADEHGIAVTLDAEESWRQEIHLDALKEALLALQIKTPYLIGTAVQAYQTRSPQVIEELVEFCQSNQITLHVRLVKGAYWDSEIKYCQQAGLKEYTVFTNKTLTDLNYLRCAARLLETPELIYPQFATHNISTIASILALTRKYNTQAFEFQKLYGMGDAIHLGLQEEYDTITRVYSPVGAHDKLLPYLVRRILENGVNSSFLNGFNLYESIELTHPYPQICQLCDDDFSNFDKLCIKAPPDIYLPERKNSPSSALEFVSHRHNIFQLWQRAIPRYQHKIYSIIGGKEVLDDGKSASNYKPITSPTINAITVGFVQPLSQITAHSAIEAASNAYKEINASDWSMRCKIIKTLAKNLFQHRENIISLLIFEAGKTPEDADAELREAIDFCFYYASQTELFFSKPSTMLGPTGELDTLEYQAKGIFVCISPWNFPLAIYLGQILAAFLAGNAVIAKPSSNTPCISHFIYRLLIESGLPSEWLQLLFMSAKDFQETVLSNESIDGVAFTGSLPGALQVNKTLSEHQNHIITPIAETGGLNMMVADSSALIEQVVLDACRSAFNSAGQRCSALRVLIVPESQKQAYIKKLSGHMRLLVTGFPFQDGTDVGPIISETAAYSIKQYILQRSANVLYQSPIEDDIANTGNYIPPTLINIDSLEDINEEIFGPVLHLLSWDEASPAQLIAKINAKPFGLTFGIHSRLPSRVKLFASSIKAGNIYINRDIVGAVVGTQPFGGNGASGTGPKAGGPNYLKAFMNEKTVSNNTAAFGGNPDILNRR